jgi:hypothetical protein
MKVAIRKEVEAVQEIETIKDEEKDLAAGNEKEIETEKVEIEKVETEAVIEKAEIEKVEIEKVEIEIEIDEIDQVQVAGSDMKVLQLKGIELHQEIKDLLETKTE